MAEFVQDDRPPILWARMEPSDVERAATEAYRVGWSHGWRAATAAQKTAARAEPASEELGIETGDQRCPARIGIYKSGCDDRCRFQAPHEGHHQTTVGHLFD